MVRYPKGGSARNGDPSQCHDAAKQDFTPLEREVTNTVLRYGDNNNQRPCVVEIWHRMPEHSIDSISPRMKRLVSKGKLIKYPKEPRGNRYGKLRKQFVYTVT